MPQPVHMIHDQVSNLFDHIFLKFGAMITPFDQGLAIVYRQSVSRRNVGALFDFSLDAIGRRQVFDDRVFWFAEKVCHRGNGAGAFGLFGMASFCVMALDQEPRLE
jgi:hypothetical protein